MEKIKPDTNKYVLFLGFVNRFQVNLSSDLNLKLMSTINDEHNHKYIEFYEDDVGNIIALKYKVNDTDVKFNNTDMIIRNVIIDNYADVYYDKRGAWERLDITPIIETYLQDISAFIRMSLHKRKVRYIV